MWEDERITRGRVESALKRFGYDYFWAGVHLKPAFRLLRSWRNRGPLMMRIPVSVSLCQAIICVYRSGLVRSSGVFLGGLRGASRAPRNFESVSPKRAEAVEEECVVVDPRRREDLAQVRSAPACRPRRTANFRANCRRAVSSKNSQRSRTARSPGRTFP